MLFHSLCRSCVTVNRMDEDNELTEIFMDKWVTIGIACGVVLAAVIIVVIISLLACFIWRRKSEPSKSSKNRSDSELNLKERSNPYVPNLVNATQPYYVQPSEDQKLAPSAEMLHYQYQRDRSPAQTYPSAPPAPQFPAEGEYVYEVPGLASPGDEKESGEENVSAYFEPIVSRPLISVKTLEEDETISRAKLFRFDAKSEEPEWKERGTGELKVLRSPGTHHSRVIMRRDKTLKICANHHILPCMELQAITGSSRSFIWKAPNDFADNAVKAQILGVRFANAEIAQEFKKVFDKCKQSLWGPLDPPATYPEKGALELLKDTTKKSDSTTPESESKAAENHLSDRFSKLELQSTMEKQSIDVTAH
ncbi:Ran-specific GTPase-activating protein [Taenia crassiceps]|uniref:Ran-specific GTPase-activating protein n=1 Tax=Taenia crassiceps TaxID=6207 RepID=A0ABR4QHC1_9CEST